MELLEDVNHSAMEELAAHLDLQPVRTTVIDSLYSVSRHVKVGWIFTDLEPDGRGGKVAYKRSIVC